jgi:hypothetical protein
VHARSRSRRALRLAVAACTVTACASVGVHPAPLATIALPPQFEGTWVRTTSVTLVSAAGSVAPRPAPDTLRIGRTFSYRPDSVVPELSDSTVQAILASPAGSSLANTTDLQTRAPPIVPVANTSVKLRGDTVVIESTVTSPDAGLIARSTTREYLSPDNTRLFVETTTPNPLRDAQLREEGLPPGTPGPSKRVVVYTRAP